MKKVYVGLSGGVDSAMTAYLLKKQGYNVTGVFIINWDGHLEQCTIKKDLEDASNIAKFLDIPFETVNFIRQYKERVFDDFISKLEQGLTPNPDIFCNKYVKFRAFLDWALECGADKVATGHYACIDSHHRLISGDDPIKDQTYFLYAIKREVLPKVLFPLGQYKKNEVRLLAKDIGLPVHNKKDSTGICFIGPKNFRDFISGYIPQRKGDIKTQSGDIIGTHFGLMFYTLGQRSGLNIGGQKHYSDRPWYVVEKDFQSNCLIVSQNKDDPALLGNELACDDFHWLIDPVITTFKAQCRIRHGQEKQDCWVYPDKNDPAKVLVKFTNEQRAITPGQAAVLYSDAICIGGGTISS